MEKKECPLKLIFDILKKQLLSIFGKPNEGIHSYRICDIAYIDVIFTIIGAYLIKRYFYPINIKFFNKAIFKKNLSIS